MSVDRTLSDEEDSISVRLADGSTVEIYGDGSWDVEVRSTEAGGYEHLRSTYHLGDVEILGPRDF